MKRYQSRANEFNQSLGTALIDRQTPPLGHGHYLTRNGGESDEAQKQMTKKINQFLVVLKSVRHLVTHLSPPLEKEWIGVEWSGVGGRGEAMGLKHSKGITSPTAELVESEKRCTLPPSPCQDLRLGAAPALRLCWCRH